MSLSLLSLSLSVTSRREGRLDNGLVEQEGFADVFDFGDGAFEVEGFGENDFKDLDGRVELV